MPYQFSSFPVSVVVVVIVVINFYCVKVKAIASKCFIITNAKKKVFEEMK